jgi:hypothetical protein
MQSIGENDFECFAGTGLDRPLIAKCMAVDRQPVASSTAILMRLNLTQVPDCRGALLGQIDEKRDTLKASALDLKKVSD